MVQTDRTGGRSLRYLFCRWGPVRYDVGTGRRSTSLPKIWGDDRNAGTLGSRLGGTPPWTRCASSSGFLGLDPHQVYNFGVSNADAATALHNASLMPPHNQDDSSPIDLDHLSRSENSSLSESAGKGVALASSPAPAPVSDRPKVPQPVQPVDRRRPDETLAGQSAVLLAKTQATAAWVQSETLWRQVKDMERQMADERGEAERTSAELDSLRRELESERHERTAAQAASDELRRYLDQQQSHLGFLRDRIVSMESERDLQQSCLGWMGRRRFRRLLQQRWEANPRSALMADDPDGALSVGNPLSVPEDATGQHFQPG